MLMELNERCEDYEMKINTSKMNGGMMIVRKLWMRRMKQEKNSYK